MEYHYHYFAQAYGQSSYGVCTYQGDANCEEVTDGGAGSPGAPNTGFLGIPGHVNSFVNSGPQVIIPSILVSAVFVALIIMVVKRTLRRGRGQAK